MTRGSAPETAVLEEALRHYRQGRDAYADSRLSETIEQLDRARSLAYGSGASDLEETTRFWQGAALHGAGRLVEALAVWAPTIAGMSEAELSPDGYLMLTRYLLVAIDLPLPLDTIERAFREVEDCIAASGHGAGRRSRLLLARSRLALLRGRVDDALSLALEALVRCRYESPTYSYSTHYRAATRTGLLAGQTSLVAELIDEWQHIPREYPQSQRFAMAAARSDLARYLGDPDAALRHAEAVAADALISDDLAYAVDANMAYARACLAAGVPDRARPQIRRLLAFRHGPIGELRFRAKLLLGDYHSTRSMVAANAAVRDLEFAREAGAGTRVGCGAAWHDARAERAYARAERAYAAAEREACRLDALLETQYRREIVASRRA